MASVGEEESDVVLTNVEGDEPAPIMMKNPSQEDVSMEKFWELLTKLDRHARLKALANEAIKKLFLTWNHC
ncbi:paramyosin [Fagus crenata]